jgi:hypothetical protein
MNPKLAFFALLDSESAISRKGERLNRPPFPLKTLSTVPLVPGTSEPVPQQFAIKEENLADLEPQPDG